MNKTSLNRFLVSHSGNPKSKIQNRKWAGLFAIVVVLTVCGARAEAQQPTKTPRIGYLTATSLFAISDRVEAFRQGLRELGYFEGKNIVIEWRSAEGKTQRVPTLVAELVGLKVNVIVSGGPLVTRAAEEATTTIPIVMAMDDDPVGNKFVVSLARPGGNITGLSRLAPELSGKRLEILKEVVPKLSRVAVFGTSTNPGNTQALKEVELAAGAFGVKVQSLDILSPKDIETGFQAAVKGRVDAGLVMVSGAIASTQRTQIVALSVKSRLPVIYEFPTYVEAGGLMFYGVKLADLDRRAATYVDKILKGRKPADLPVEQPIKFELIINLKAAKQIGLTIPPNVLARAVKLIK
jgi:putative ABC transport system substrate-binding protein